jgi:hypothetical protein
MHSDENCFRFSNIDQNTHPHRHTLTLTSSCRALPTFDSAWCSASCHLAEHHLLLIVHGAQHHVVLPSTKFSASHGAEHYEVN